MCFFLHRCSTCTLNKLQRYLAWHIREKSTRKPLKCSQMSRPGKVLYTEAYRKKFNLRLFHHSTFISSCPQVDSPVRWTRLGCKANSIRDLESRLPANGKRQIVQRDQLFPWLSREVKFHVYVKRQTRICTTWPSVLFTCRLLFIISTHKLVASNNFYP